MAVEAAAAAEEEEEVVVEVVVVAVAEAAACLRWTRPSWRTCMHLMLYSSREVPRAG